MKKTLALLLLVLVAMPRVAHAYLSCGSLNDDCGAGSSVAGGSCPAGQIETGINTNGTPICTQKTDPIVCGFIGVQQVSNQEMCWVPITKAETLPIGCTGSKASAKVAATGTPAITINQYSAGIFVASDSVAWAASGTQGTFTCSGALTFVPGDVVEMIAPASADATLATAGVTLQMVAGAL